MAHVQVPAPVRPPMSVSWDRQAIGTHRIAVDSLAVPVIGSYSVHITAVRHQGLIMRKKHAIAVLAGWSSVGGASLLNTHLAIAMLALVLAIITFAALAVYSRTKTRRDASFRILRTLLSLLGHTQAGAD
jgi:hypothetical protein